jgi:hypothetical protein
VDGGWKLKPLHKLMVMSTTYRQSSRNDAALRIDPDGKLYGRFKLQRLDAEALRDSMLAAAGTLNSMAFGAPVGITRDPAGRVVVGKERPVAIKDVDKVESLGRDDFRRSIYVQARRSMPLTVLDTFDEPTMSPNCDARNCSTVAPQSLMMLNDTFVLEAARSLATRLRTEVPDDTRGQIVRAWCILFGRTPQETDLQSDLAHVAEQTEAFRASQANAQPAKGTPPDPSLDALASLCQVLLASNRFLYIE